MDAAHAAQTREAVKIYNDLAEGGPVAGLFHSTCRRPVPLAPGHDKACGAISLRRHCPDQVLGVADQLLRCRLLSRPAARPVSPGSSYGPAPSLTSQTYSGCMAPISLPRAGSPACLDRMSVLRVLLHVFGPRLAWRLCAPRSWRSQARLLTRLVRRVADPSGIWPVRASTIRHIPPASLALGLAPDIRPLILVGRPQPWGSRPPAGRSVSIPDLLVGAERTRLSAVWWRPGEPAAGRWAEVQSVSMRGRVCAAYSGSCGRIAASARWMSSAGQLAGSRGSLPLMSMMMASGHGACTAAILVATQGSASEELSVRLLMRRAVSAGGAVHCSWTRLAVALSAVTAAAARCSAEIQVASAITDSPSVSSSAAR